MINTSDDGGWDRAKARAKKFLLLRASTEQVGAYGAHALPLLEDGRAFALRQAPEFRRRAQVLWLPEDPDTILSQSSLFEPFATSGPEPELQSLAWRGDALLGLSAIGVVALEDEVVAITRKLFHDGLRHQDLSHRLFGADFDAIHGFMDTVPGSGVRGGGFVHRLQHGHDLGAAREIYQEHGLPGLLAWVQHMAQDSTTPTGVPVPGGIPLSEWLIAKGLATPGKAALLVSFNIAELAAAVLAGTFMLRLTVLLAEIQKKRRIRQRVPGARCLGGRRPRRGKKTTAPEKRRSLPGRAPRRDRRSRSCDPPPNGRRAIPMRSYKSTMPSTPGSSGSAPTK